jgi:hypothetical protein
MSKLGWQISLRRNLTRRKMLALRCTGGLRARFASSLCSPWCAIRALLKRRVQN